MPLRLKRCRARTGFRLCLRALIPVALFHGIKVCGLISMPANGRIWPAGLAVQACTQLLLTPCSCAKRWRKVPAHALVGYVRVLALGLPGRLARRPGWGLVPLAEAHPGAYHLPPGLAEPVPCRFQWSRRSLRQAPPVWLFRERQLVQLLIGGAEPRRLTRCYNPLNWGLLIVLVYRWS